jgi:hypothetical protein
MGALGPLKGPTVAARSRLHFYWSLAPRTRRHFLLNPSKEPAKPNRSLVRTCLNGASHSSRALGDFTFMKTQRTLAILWLAAFVAALYYWIWEFLHKSAPAYDGIHARLSPIFIFGIVACVFLFQGAKWARISIGTIALLLGAGVFFGEILPQGWMRVDKLADDAAFVFSLLTVVLLFFRKYEPVA